MARSILDLSWDELDALAQEAGAEAVSRAHAAGLSTFGVIEQKRVTCSPDGNLSYGAKISRADLDKAQIAREHDAQPAPEPVAVVLTPRDRISRGRFRDFKQKA